MKKLAIKLLLTINAATNGECCSSLERETVKIRSINEDDLRGRLEQLRKLFKLVTTLPILSFPPDGEWVKFVRGIINEKSRERAI